MKPAQKAARSSGIPCSISVIQFRTFAFAVMMLASRSLLASTAGAWARPRAVAAAAAQFHAGANRQRPMEASGQMTSKGPPTLTPFFIVDR